jgi:hypothetical protein
MMITRLQQHKELNLFLTIGILLICVSIINYACQTKRTNKTMSEEKSDQQPLDTGRLLTVANLEQADSSSNVVAWFFETPQVFEFRLGTEKSQGIYNLLKEAKEKQLPVNVYSSVIQDKNIIDLVKPATEVQIHLYNNEKAQRQQPVRIPQPPNK